MGGTAKGALVPELLGETDVDKIALYDSVRRMNAEAKACGILDHEASPQSDDTKRTYGRIWTRDQESKTGLEGVSGRSWHTHKSALRWGMSEAFRKAKTGQGQAQRRGDVEEAQKLVDEALELVERWKALETAEKPQRSPRSRSKRLHVPRTEDWQMGVWKAAKSQHKDAVAVVWASGCRPIEMERGITVDLDQDGDPVLTITGGKARIDKHGNQIGQKERQITLSRFCILGLRLVDMCHDGPTTIRMKRKRLEKVLEEAGKRAGLKNRLSAYVFRHQVGGDMKAGGDQEETAKVLGHVSGESQQHYGHWKQAKSGTIVRVKASSPVRKLGTRFETRPSMEGPGF